MRPAPPIALCWSLLVAAVVHGAPNEHKLYLDLLRDYDSLERPVANSSEAITVRLGLALQQLINVVRTPTLPILYFAINFST